MDRWVDEQEAEWTHRCVGKSVGVWMSASVRRSVGVGGGAWRDRTTGGENETRVGLTQTLPLQGEETFSAQSSLPRA